MQRRARPGRRRWLPAFPLSPRAGVGQLGGGRCSSGVGGPLRRRGDPAAARVVAWRGGAAPWRLRAVVAGPHLGLGGLPPAWWRLSLWSSVRSWFGTTAMVAPLLQCGGGALRALLGPAGPVRAWSALRLHQVGYCLLAVEVDPFRVPLCHRLSPASLPSVPSASRFGPRRDDGDACKIVVACAGGR